ncbi:argininosuccinate lyase [Pseudovibrio sp. Tun.PSC04-5.I4]|uniref:argininosuccinate lyase n=1 Tax=Pseudovibrio sp. Tun.PSC04-5.I4 TaxID=1798213 RepID=UPI00088CF39E|nr:argininosuccinate lyase [Pseudovibrio sp. Tun.PSC04-5.I4]SDR13969.1 argininosuccinate lyase [Pseudovibrio sp. Tun.PSC04-5.I4]
MIDNSIFPHPVYKDTVLAPLFEGVKAHHVSSITQINQAHLVMLCETGIVPIETGKQIASALIEIEKDLADANPEYTGEYEDYFFLVEAELRKRVGPDIAGMLHTARSRNDMDHTVFKLALAKRCDELTQQALHLCDVLTKKAEVEKETLIVAYTHGQPAQPSTFGHYLCAVLEVLLRDLQRLQLAREGIDHCPMGAAAITTSGFPINRERMAELLGFSAPLLNSYGCIASVDYVTGLYSAIKLMFLHLGRVIQDMQFWSAFEVGQLYVPNSLVQISSIMPQKRNPVPIEHLRHLASVTVGRCDAIVGTMHNTPFTDMNDSEGEVQQAGYAAFESGSRVLDLFAALISASSINEERVAKNTDASCITITELADTLVREEGLSFRQAHEIAADTAKAVIADQKPLREGFTPFSTAFEAHAGKAPKMNHERFIHAVSPQNFVAIRTRPGGPAPCALDAALEQYQQTSKSLRTKNKSFVDQSTLAARLRGAAFAKLVQE